MPDNGLNPRPLAVLDIFCGLKGFSRAFAERGHQVATVDWGKEFEPDLVADVMALSAADLSPRRFGIDADRWDAVLASPPCECFSVMTIGRNWTRDDRPRNPAAAKALGLVRHALLLIEDLAPSYRLIENPRAKLRKLIGPPTDTAWWCQYGDKKAKPTDIWGRLPPGLLPLKKCRNGAPDHDRAPRGSKTGGTQDGSKSAAERAVIPYGFSLAVCEAVEAALGISGCPVAPARILPRTLLDFAAGG